MAPLPKFVNSPAGRLLHLVVGAILAVLGLMLYTSTAGAGLLGLGVFGVAGGIFSRSYARFLQFFFGSPKQHDVYRDVSEADESLYELNFVRQSLRRGRKE